MKKVVILSLIIVFQNNFGMVAEDLSLGTSAIPTMSVTKLSSSETSQEWSSFDRGSGEYSESMILAEDFVKTVGDRTSNLDPHLDLERIEGLQEAPEIDPTETEVDALISENPSLNFYDQTPRSMFDDADINHFGWDANTGEFCVTLLLGRHVGDKNNLSKTAHTSSAHSEINLETIGMEKALSLMSLGYVFKFDAIAGGTTDRHEITTRLVATAYHEIKKYYLMPEFNEQKLGHLGGKHESEILRDIEFKKMFSDQTYKMKKDEKEIDEDSESGQEVIKRFNAGIQKLIRTIYSKRKKLIESNAIKIPIKRQLEFFGKNMLIYICTSRCTLNWMIKCFMKNMSLPLQLKSLANCNLFCINYYPNKGTYNVLLNRDNMPYCISPLHFIHFALQSPVFDTYIQESYQKVTKIIRKPEKVLLPDDRIDSDEQTGVHKIKLKRKSKSCWSVIRTFLRECLFSQSIICSDLEKNI